MANICNAFTRDQRDERERERESRERNQKETRKKLERQPYIDYQDSQREWEKARDSQRVLESAIECWRALESGIEGNLENLMTDKETNRQEDGRTNLQSQSLSCYCD